MPSEVEEFEIDPRIRRLVWRGMGTKSLKEIAQETGLSREEILRVSHELLEGVDVLTVMQKRQKLLVELESLAYEARERAQGMPDEFYSGAINSSVAAIKAVQAELSRISKQDDAKVEALNQKRIRELVSLIREVVDTSVTEVAKAHDLPEDELFEVFNRNLEAAASRRDAL